ncbi:MAG: 4-alpha-glucanotransferase [Spirochaetaceae bacterium]|jgi:4-alpha-glucanotransferase|nr:4-alpha-glucanotransferase [Spirochaetaceae bacterium]
MAENKTEKRLIGIVTPVGALRGKDSAGCGEFLDLVEFAQFCAGMGIGLIQLLPVNDTGYESSPYFALTAFALNPIYIKLSALQEAAQYTKKIDEIRSNFDAAARFSYEKVAHAKLSLLREIFTANKASIEKLPDLKKWIEKTPWIKTYAVFRRLKEINGLKSWQEWKAFRSVTPKEREALWNDPAAADEHFFWAWVQFNLDVQFSKAAEAIRKLDLVLEGDLPILMNEDSADVWAYPEYFNNEFSAGAPPDMYSPEGQNWGFPIYNWEAQEKDGFTWWRGRLAAAEKYFSAYRIDHVLGFFRIWASSRRNRTALLGRLIPSAPIKTTDIKACGFDEPRIRWLSLPHIPTGDVWDAVRAHGGNDDDARHVFNTVLIRIANEELWLFKPEIDGEKAIEILPIHDGAKSCLLAAWNNRVFQEYEPANFSAVWNYRSSRAWSSLSNEEKERLELLIAKKSEESEKKWETEGKKLLSMLKESSTMLPCAEDLGAVPECVPRVLTKLKILGLRVIRWTRKWNEAGAPYVPFYDYPELSVCTPAVHDSSTVREWWEREADQAAFTALTGEPHIPSIYSPGAARIILKHAATAASRFCVFQIQDILHLSPQWYAEDCASERVNVPGTANEFNWTYRIPAVISELTKDEKLKQAMLELIAAQPMTKPKKGKK